MNSNMTIDKLKVAKNGSVEVYISGGVFGYDDAKKFAAAQLGNKIDMEKASIRISWGEEYIKAVTDDVLRAKLWNTIREYVCDKHPASCAMLRLEGSAHKITPEGVFILVNPMAYTILKNENIADEIRKFLKTLFKETVPVSIREAEDVKAGSSRRGRKKEQVYYYDEEAYNKEVAETIKNNKDKRKTKRAAGSYYSDHYKGGGSGKKRILTPKDGAELPKDTKGNTMLIGGEIVDEPVRMDTINADIGFVAVKGRVFKLETKPIRNNSRIAILYITDETYSVAAKFFFEPEDDAFVEKHFAAGSHLILYGDIAYDKYSKELSLLIRNASSYKPEKRVDHAEKKRVELHLHTTLSALDALTRPKELIKRVTEWGHSAIAITDHGVVQAYPDVFNAAKDLKSDIKIIYGIECYLTDFPEETDPETSKKFRTWHCIILVKNLVGLKNLYRLISNSNLSYFHRRPRMPRFDIDANREGLIIGSACSEGELYQAIVDGASDEELEKIASFYDYLEIQPIENNIYLVREGRVASEQELVNINKKILGLADRLGKLTVATCDVHFLDPEDAIYREVMQTAQGYKDAAFQAPLYLRTTEEMLAEFAHLEERAYEVVVENTNKIADMIEVIRPVPKGTYQPSIEGSDEDLRSMCLKKAVDTYGDPVPEHVMARLNKELDAIISNHFSVLYIAAQKLVAHSAENGYTVGSRGSVGSSLAAYMAGITEVNALPPHYRCPECKYSEFYFNQEYEAGCDMPEKDCPKCGTKLIRDGFDIPFETFLGFKGEKTPDIDLNFASEDQVRAHKYCDVLFGEKYVFRAGTIAGLQDKTAMGYVRKYLEVTGRAANEAEMMRLSAPLEGVKKTTGQHPGGIMVVPRDKDILDFTPIQHPADDDGKGVVTTHFDYHFLHDTILKLDILGHDGPKIVKMLHTFTGIDPMKIDISDPEVLSLFVSPEPLNADQALLNEPLETGSLGIPEFGTSFAIGLLKSTKPKTVSDLVRISGLSHGTNVWQDNASELIENNVATLSECICCRDDIMIYLIKMGVEKEIAFNVMEAVRKGKVASGKCPEWPKWKEELKAHNVPDWYLGSCEKIQYMFPKAHAVAYVLLSVRMAWYKIYEPLAYYATRFTLKLEFFEGHNMINGIDKAKLAQKDLKQKGTREKLSKKEEDLLVIYEQIVEMYARHIEFLPVDLYKSKAAMFVPEDGKLRPPFCALQGVGITAGESLEKAASTGEEFSSIEDVRNRAKVNKTVIEVLRANGVLTGLPEDDALTFFDWADKK
ncbi:MAG: PolC-type DNA polymerase III [Clostridia bacterium]|nr:PolC-type DNA polymerase III [Clostridia bacterium]